MKHDLLILDGAMGTELERRGFTLPAPLWSAQALTDAPDLVRRIHADYLAAGAHVLTTNSFRTQKRTLERAGLSTRARHLTMLSAELAKEAVKDAGARAMVAGSVAPLEDCFRPDLSPGEADQEFVEIGWDLMDAGADFLLIETMNNLTELRSAIRAAQVLGAPFWVSVVPVREPGIGYRGTGRDSIPENRDPSPVARLLSSEPLLDALRLAEGEGAARFLVNCAGMPVIGAAVAEIASTARIPFGGYANNGVLENGRWRFDREVSPAEFAEHAARLVAMGATAVGGCCGATPDHIRAITERLRG